jgi:hypothetical protein
VDAGVYVCAHKYAQEMCFKTVVMIFEGVNPLGKVQIHNLERKTSLENQKCNRKWRMRL